MFENIRIFLSELFGVRIHNSYLDEGVVFRDGYGRTYRLFYGDDGFLETMVRIS